MSLAAVLVECVSITSGVTGVGIIRNYEAVAATEDQLRTAFFSGGEINAIEIVRGSTESIYFANQRSQDDHTINFNIYRGVAVDDESTSRAAHEALVEAVKDEFRGNYRLNGMAQKVDMMQVPIDGHIMKGGLLLHYSLGTMVVRLDFE